MNTGEITLLEARRQLFSQLETGARCPCCEQFAKIYRWNLYSTAVKALILYYRLGSTTEFVHSNQLKNYNYKGQGDAARLRVWGLVEGEKARRDDGGRSGWWIVTDLGEQFIHGRASIPKYVYIYAGSVIDQSSEQVMIHDVIHNAFDYTQMMDSATLEGG